MDHENRWLKLTSADPGHSQWYIDRFRAMAEAGADLAGEARLVDAMVPRGARVLDAGCGAGRVGGHLAAAGHQVVGVDLDPVLVEAARRDHPAAHWLVADLAELDLPARGIPEGFDVVVCAGNVMAFLAPASRREVLRRLGAHLRPDGRVVTGFGAGRDYDFDEFLADVDAAGLTPDLLLATWDLRPFTTGADFLVAVLRPAGPRRPGDEPAADKPPGDQPPADTPPGDEPAADTPPGDEPAADGRPAAAAGPGAA